MPAAKAKTVTIRYKVRSVGIRPGDEAEVSEAQADDLVANGHATRVEEKPKKKG